MYSSIIMQYDKIIETDTKSFLKYVYIDVLGNKIYYIIVIKKLCNE